MAQTDYTESPFEGAYPWDYLKPESSDRQKTLESLVGPYVNGKETVLDVCCGFSTLSRFLLAKGCQVVGMDSSAEAIAYCRQAYPGGTYDLIDDATAEILAHLDMLLHLGITAGNDPWGLESRTEVATSIRAIRRTLPRIIVLEAAVAHAGGYKELN